MNNAELIQAFRAEIEMRIKECEATYPKGGYWFPEQEEAYAIAEEYKQLLSFLSTLESDSSEIPNDLEEAAKAYALDTAEDSEQYSARYLGYKDGAKWQKEQDDKELSEKIASAYQLGLADKEKQMLKEAVEVVVWDAGVDFAPHPVISVEDFNVKDGDKVRIIIVKED